MWARLFKTKGKGAGNYSSGKRIINHVALAPVETPELYLQLTKRCMKEVDSMLSPGASTSPKFDHEQCKYLADKLRVAVQSAHSFSESTNPRYIKNYLKKDEVQVLDLFKLLFALGKEVESFIQGCCKDAWLDPAFLLTSMPEAISSLGFELEFCTKIFPYWKTFGDRFTVAKLSNLRQAEVGIVAEKAYSDKENLVENLNAVILSSKASTVERQQANFLLEQLKIATLDFGAYLPGSTESSHPDVSISSLKQVKKLGSGTFGSVHEVKWLGSEVARKTFHGLRPPDFEQEISILEGLRHPNIVSLLWHTRDERKCYMIMELMDGDLCSLMQERSEECRHVHPPFSISEAVHIMLQIAEGMRFLHKLKIVHRDLKSSNILVKLPKASEVGITNLHVKVADFGLSRTKENSETYSQQTQNQGTTRWMAPEMIKIADAAGKAKSPEQEMKLQYPFKVDVYSFAIVCYEILTGELPFSELRYPCEVKAKVLGGGRPSLPDQCPEKLKNVIEACWSTEPSMRPSFDIICGELQLWTCAWLCLGTL